MAWDYQDMKTFWEGRKKSNNYRTMTTISRNVRLEYDNETDEFLVKLHGTTVIRTSQRGHTVASSYDSMTTRRVQTEITGAWFTRDVRAFPQHPQRVNGWPLLVGMKIGFNGHVDADSQRRDVVVQPTTVAKTRFRKLMAYLRLSLAVRFELGEFDDTRYDAISPGQAAGLLAAIEADREAGHGIDTASARLLLSFGGYWLRPKGYAFDQFMKKMSSLRMAYARCIGETERVEK